MALLGGVGTWAELQAALGCLLQLRKCPRPVGLASPEAPLLPLHLQGLLRAGQGPPAAEEVHSRGAEAYAGPGYPGEQRGSLL